MKLHSFNLGDGTVTLESNQTALNVWQTVEVRRNGRQGTLVVNGAVHGQVHIIIFGFNYKSSIRQNLYTVIALGRRNEFFQI